MPRVPVKSRARAKTTKNRSPKKPKTVPRPDGRGALNTGGTPGNSGGKKGRSGRPPKRFKSFLADLRQDPAVQGELEETLKDRESRHYAAALKVLTDYDDDLPTNLTPEERASRIQEYLRIAAERRAAVEKATEAKPKA